MVACTLGACLHDRSAARQPRRCWLLAPHHTIALRAHGPRKSRALCYFKNRGRRPQSYVCVWPVQFCRQLSTPSLLLANERVVVEWGRAGRFSNQDAYLIAGAYEETSALFSSTLSTRVNVSHSSQLPPKKTDKNLRALPQDRDGTHVQPCHRRDSVSAPWTNPFCRQFA